MLISYFQKNIVKTAALIFRSLNKQILAWKANSAVTYQTAPEPWSSLIWDCSVGQNYFIERVVAQCKSLTRDCKITGPSLTKGTALHS